MGCSLTVNSAEKVLLNQKCLQVLTEIKFPVKTCAQPSSWLVVKSSMIGVLANSNDPRSFHCEVSDSLLYYCLKEKITLVLEKKSVLFLNNPVAVVLCMCPFNCSPSKIILAVLSFSRFLFLNIWWACETGCGHWD